MAIENLSALITFRSKLEPRAVRSKDDFKNALIGARDILGLDDAHLSDLLEVGAKTLATWRKGEAPPTDMWKKILAPIVEVADEQIAESRQQLSENDPEKKVVVFADQRLRRAVSHTSQGNARSR